MIAKQKFIFFIKHLNLRLVYSLLSFAIALLCCYCYSDPLLYLFIKPFLLEIYSNRFIFTNLIEIFFTYIKFSCLTALIIALPILIFQLWLFFIPGLFRWERRKLTLALLISVSFLCMGYGISYKIILPSISNFFLNFDSNNLYFPLHFEAKIYDYLFFLLAIMLNIIVCFQMPPLIIVLSLFEIIDCKFLMRKRKIFYFILLFLATLLSSPELLNQLAMLSMLIILYEFSILCLYFLKYINF